MCGILVFVRPSFEPSLESLKKRGPDDSSSFKDDDIFMGHTRLALVRPNAPGQPIFYKEWVGIMNGEIYNAVIGENETDCHHLVKTIVDHGPEAIHTLDGVFSFVLYHPTTKRIIFGRDAIGVTPMYYSKNVISSLLTCITSEKAKCVPTGSYADFIIGSDITFTKWTTQYQYKSPSKQNIVSLMSDAVRKRLMGDVPWGILLSGGLDSSIVARLAVEMAISGERPDYPSVHSFCIGLKGSPDVEKAKQLASELQTCHNSIEYTVEEGIESLRDVIRAVETYDVTTIRASTPMWLLARAIKKTGIKMVLSGEGSDELFAGYLYNLYCPNENEMEQECRRKINQLYAYDCLRANKSMGDFGIETRVPFLDKKVVDFAMNGLSPTMKLSGTHPDGPKPEKWFLRDAFREHLPDYIVDRTKAQFSDAVGSDWIDALQAYASCKVSDNDLNNASERWPFQTPDTKEALLYRRIFAEIFQHVDEADQTVIYQPSIACSTGPATKWHREFHKCLDPSGDAIHSIFKEL